MRLYKNLEEFKNVIVIEYSDSYALHIRLLGYLNKYRSKMDYSLSVGNNVDWVKYNRLYLESVDLYLESKLYLSNLLLERDRISSIIL